MRRALLACGLADFDGDGSKLDGKGVHSCGAVSSASLQLDVASAAPVGILEKDDEFDF
jgi:hypothetical protein